MGSQKKLRILVYGLNYSPELTGIGKYTGEMCHWLGSRGHEVKVVCAPPYYPNWKIFDGYRGWRYASERHSHVEIRRCPIYVPRKPRTLTRLVHLLTFAISSFAAVIAHIRWKPHVMVVVVPTMFCVPGALLAAKMSGARSLLHVQDLEVDAAVGLGLKKAGLSVRWALKVERLLLQRFDAISSVSKNMLARIAEKCGRDVLMLEFPNWVDTNFVNDSTQVSPYRQEWGIHESAFVVMYSGNLGEKQGLEGVLDAAAAFEDDYRIQFVIVGNGAAEGRLRSKAAIVGLTNVRFFPLQPYERLPQLMALADLHLVLQRTGVADLVMPSKLATIFAFGGQALVTADRETEIGRICVEHPGIAMRIEPENGLALIEGIRLALSGSIAGRRHSNRVARQYALEKLERESILSRFEQNLVRLSSCGLDNGFTS